MKQYLVSTHEGNFSGVASLVTYVIEDNLVEVSIKENNGTRTLVIPLSNLEFIDIQPKRD